MADEPKPPVPGDGEGQGRLRLQEAVGEDFRVRTLLGRGGFADVFEAWDPQLKRPVALKVLRSDVQVGPEAPDRFRREAEAIARVRHPNILPIHAIGEGAGLVYLVLQRVDGEALDRYLDEVGLLSVDEAVRILRETARGLAAAHDVGIVHRDLKPANILLEGRERRVLLTDFGIARAVEGESPGITGTGVILGTPHYMSPEQVAGDAVDHRTDLYALGVLGYRLVTGRPPHDGPTSAAVMVKHLTETPRPIRELRRDCPPWVARVIERCLAKSPEERYGSAGEFLEEWERGEGGAAVVREAAGDDDQVAPGTPARRLLRDGAALIGMALLGGIADLGFTGTLSFSPFLALACFAALALRYGAFVRSGDAPGDRRVLQGTGPGADEALGRHGSAVRRARIDRTNIVRSLAGLTRAEADLAMACGEAADDLLAQVVRCAKRLSALDERIGTERGRSGEAHGRWAPRQLLDELVDARDEAAAELDEVLGALARLRETASRAGRVESGDFRRSLDEALSGARRVVEG